MITHDDRWRLQHMLEACRDIEHILPEGETNRTAQLAIARCLQIVGEAARQVSHATQLATPEIPWRAIIGMRHKIIHEYFRVENPIIWRTAMDQVPELLDKLEQLINDA